MLNLIIFLSSVALVFAAWSGYRKDSDKKTSTKQHVIALLVISLLFLPLNIDGTVYTILGSGNAENNFNSVFSFYQDAKDGKANQLFGIGFQFAKKGCFTGLGLIYQSSHEKSETGIGISWQESKKATTIIGISLYQKGDTLSMGPGISCYQNAKDESFCFFGISLFQKGKISLTIGISGFQKSDSRSGTIGVNFYQTGKREANTLGFNGYQSSKHKTTTMGFNGFQSGDTTKVIGINSYSKASHFHNNSAGITLIANVAKNIRTFSAFSKNKAEK